MKYLLIQNQGLIDPLGIVLMGASPKRGDNTKIGEFGTGNKYSTATMLAHGIPFRIFSGMSEIHVKTKPIVFEGKTFDKIYLEKDGEVIDTTLTAQMGPQWKPWYAIREVYCNAIDAGGHQVIPMTENVQPSEGVTRFYIGITEEVEPVIANWNKYFSADRLDIFEELPGLKLHYRLDKGLRIYRKGVLVHEDDQIDGLFDYDLENAEINEMRILTSMYSTKWEIEKIIDRHASVDLIRRILKNIHIAIIEKKRILEQDMSLGYFANENKANWQEAIKGFNFVNESVAGRYQDAQQHDNTLVLPSSIINRLVDNVSNEITTFGVPRNGVKHPHKNIEIDDAQSAMIEECIAFLDKAGLDFNGMNIQCVEFDNYAIRGTTDMKKNIYIGKSALEAGKRAVAEVLLEEWFHIESKMGDETRAFQNYILNKVLLEYEKRLCIYL
jgi:hypothetical protein